MEKRPTIDDVFVKMKEAYELLLELMTGGIVQHVDRARVRDAYNWFKKNGGNDVDWESGVRKLGYTSSASMSEVDFDRFVSDLSRVLKENKK